MLLDDALLKVLSHYGVADRFIVEQLEYVMLPGTVTLPALQ
jgi:hypothetical protein